jgi:hypothetical protein
MSTETSDINLPLATCFVYLGLVGAKANVSATGKKDSMGDLLERSAKHWLPRIEIEWPLISNICQYLPSRVNLLQRNLNHVNFQDIFIYATFIFNFLQALSENSVPPLYCGRKQFSKSATVQIICYFVNVEYPEGILLKENDFRVRSYFVPCWRLGDRRILSNEFAVCENKIGALLSGSWIGNEYNNEHTSQSQHDASTSTLVSSQDHVDPQCTRCWLIVNGHECRYFCPFCWEESWTYDQRQEHIKKE